MGLSSESGTFQKVITLGIDIGADQVVCALLTRSGKTVEFRKSWIVEFREGTSAAEDLKESLKRECPTPPDAIATAMPGALVSHRILHLPFKETAKLQATIPFQIESEVPLDIDTSVVAWTVLAEAPHSATVFAAVCRNEDISSHLAFLEQAGVDPSLVTLGMLATAELLGSPVENTLLIDLRHDGGLATIEDGEIRKLHNFGSTEQDAMLDEVQWGTAVYANDGATQAVITQESPLTAKLSLPEGVGRKSLREQVAGWLSGAPEEALRAIALANAAGYPPQRRLNFRTGGFAYHAPSEEAHRQLRRTAWIAAAAALIVLGTWFAMFAERRAELDELRSRISAQTNVIAPKAPRGTEVRRVRAALEQLEKKSALLGGGNLGAPTLDRLLAIHSAIPLKVPLEVADLTLDSTGVRFRGRTDTFESVDIVSSALASLPEFTAANVQDVKAGVDGRIDFRVTLEIDKG